MDSMADWSPRVHFRRDATGRLNYPRHLPGLIDMRRILCVLFLALGLSQSAMAGQTEQVSALLAQKFGVARAKADQIAEAVMKSASKYSLPPSLLLAVIAIESRFREKAHGANGATGLMQIVPSSHRKLLKGVKDLTEPTANIEAGSEILHGYVDSAGGDVEAGLRSYGGGKNYVAKVSNQARLFEAKLNDMKPDEPALAPASAPESEAPAVSSAGSPVSLNIR
jgi:soluble lytic murein transglycosylase-like protein